MKKTVYLGILLGISTIHAMDKNIDSHAILDNEVKDVACDETQRQAMFPLMTIDAAASLITQDLVVTDPTLLKWIERELRVLANDDTGTLISSNIVDLLKNDLAQKQLESESGEILQAWGNNTIEAVVNIVVKQILGAVICGGRIPYHVSLNPFVTAEGLRALAIHDVNDKLSHGTNYRDIKKEYTDKTRYRKNVHKLILDDILNSHLDLSIRVLLAKNLVTYGKAVEQDIVDSLKDIADSWITDNDEPTQEHPTTLISLLIERVSYSNNLKNDGPEILRQLCSALEYRPKLLKTKYNEVIYFITACIKHGVPLLDNKLQQHPIDSMITAHDNFMASLRRFEQENPKYPMSWNPRTTFSSIGDTINQKLLTHQKEHKSIADTVSIYISPNNIVQLVLNGYLNWYDRQLEIDYLNQRMDTSCAIT